MQRMEREKLVQFYTTKEIFSSSTGELEKSFSTDGFVADPH